MILNRRINAIVAADMINTIGKNNTLPWRLKADMDFFRKLTTQNVVLMGRKTYESIGKPLPNRYNVVVSRDPLYQAKGASVLSNVDEALLQAALIAADRDCEVFIIGGRDIYEQTIHSCDCMYLTRVYTQVDGGDTFFKLPTDVTFRKIEAVFSHSKDEQNDYDMRVYKYEFAM